MKIFFLLIFLSMLPLCLLLVPNDIDYSIPKQNIHGLDNKQNTQKMGMSRRKISSPTPVLMSQAIFQRQPFHPGRRAFNKKTIATTKINVAFPNIKLVASFLASGKKKIIVQDTFGKSTIIQTGGHYKGWKLNSVSKKKAQFKHESLVKTIYLKGYGK